VLALTQAQEIFWRSAGAIALVLLVANVTVLVAVHVGRLARARLRRREARCRVRLEALLAELERGPDAAGLARLRREVARLDRLERAVAGELLVERLEAASDAERARVAAGLRAIGALDVMLHATTRRVPWRRALAIRTLGWTGAAEGVPTLIERLSDRNRYVRECAVRALGRTGDPRALAPLGELFRSPGSVGGGVVYDALVAFGAAAERIFAGGLRSDDEAVRIASCFGVAAAADAAYARELLDPLVTDPSPRVRGAAVESLGQIGGAALPDGLARASRDEEPTVRTAGAVALGAFDDPRSVDLLSNMLLDPDRDTVIRAGESLVLLTRLPSAGPAASLRLHHQLHPSRPRTRIAYAADATAWTEIPSSLRPLRTQRIRWHVGLLDNLRIHREMIGRRRYGAVGLFALPFSVLFEVVDPIMQVVGYCVLVALLAVHPPSFWFLAAFVVVTVLGAQLQTAGAIVIDELVSGRYRARDLALIGFWSLLELFWYQPLTAIWRSWATVLVLLGRRPGWGTIPRGGAFHADPQQELVAAPLPR
jgi:HEAT repeat protein